MTATPVRPVRLGPGGVGVETTSAGVRYVQATQPLGDYPVRLTDRLEYWAVHAPERTLYAKRCLSSGKWRRISYAEAHALARKIGQALINRGLSPERPIAILSGNDLEHALLSSGSHVCGRPIRPHLDRLLLGFVGFCEASLHSRLGQTGPDLRFQWTEIPKRALDATRPADAELVVTEDPLPGATLFSDLTATNAAGPIPHTDGDTIVKFLFTSGSTGMPKAVINTQRMWCSNQAMIAACLPFLTDEPPVLVDWTPWNHTFGGNHDVGLTIYNGGTLYIDDGRPVAGAFEESVRNLREIATTFFLNVPRGFECLVPYLRADKQLREVFFSRLKLMWYAGASLSQPVWDELDALSIETTGERVLTLTGLDPLRLPCLRLPPGKRSSAPAWWESQPLEWN